MMTLTGEEIQSSQLHQISAAISNCFNQREM